MDPNQSPPGGIVPGPANQYDFITNPAPNQKKSLLPKLGGNSFLSKVILVIGGGVALMILMWIVAMILGGSGTNIENAVSVTQSQTEIIRVADMGQRDGNQQTRNFAVNVGMSFTTQRQQWLSFLTGQGRTLDSDELNASFNAQTDERIETAKINNAFDRTFNQIMEDALRAYATELNRAHQAASHATERELLAEHFAQTELLLQQVTAIE